MRIRRALIAGVAGISLLLAPVSPVVGNQLPSFQEPENYPWGIWSIRYPSTYNGDGIIAAKVRDVFTDGSCVQAVYVDGDTDYLQAVSCRYWANHLFYDQTADSSAFVYITRPVYPDGDYLHWISGY